MKSTIGKKILVGCGLGQAILIILIIFAYSGAGKILRSATDIMKSKELDLVLIQSEVDHLLWGKKVANTVIDTEVKNIDIQFDPHQCTFGKWYYGQSRKEAEQLAPYISKSLASIEDPHFRLHQSAEKINELLAKGDREGAKNVYLQITRPIIEKLVETFGTMQGDVKKNGLSNQALIDSIHSYQKTIGIMGLISLFFMIFTAIFIGGDIVSMLKKIMLCLRDSSEQIASASAQVSSASQSLAEGATEQAAGLEETSSSMEEMTAMTRQNAENATQANSLMKDTGKEMNEANQAMKELIQSMNEISSASEETGKIVKTIDEIAFQTNLLALNAAVEAARAGEVGAGFAVVADEVRNLSMRAAEAAKNSSILIEGTVKKIRNGSDIMNKTNEAFEKVAGGSKKVAELVGEIATTSDHQAQGINQINKAVAEMNKVVQRNSASAEELALASEEMHAQTEQMKNFVAELLPVIGRVKNKMKPVQTTLLEPTTKIIGRKGLDDKFSVKAYHEVLPEEVIPMEKGGFKEF